ncbi:EamA family transporter [Paeniroseomonas aquatica]|uniref:EamA family transporter n=1 Tax=Paeniroseomonas aquatica TaxID=373043 RepID=A0ABT8ACV5_9PROT|nr:EamA family transporter [Paeniroseomonas aquatica]MDN3567505.1 EamA family transporter [Paeniroseomonas aquatica]
MPPWLAGGVFVPLWSSGILFGALAIRHGPPFAVTGLRFAAAAAILAGLALLRRAPWPRGAALGHAAMVGLLLQGGHYAGIYAGMAAGMEAGVAALVVGLIPVATAAGAAVLLAEAFTRRRALAAGLGLLAAALVAGNRVGFGPGAPATGSASARAPPPRPWRPCRWPAGPGRRCGRSASAPAGRGCPRPPSSSPRARR